MPAPHETRLVQPASRVRGTVDLPGDKSISHRYAMLGAIAEGVTTLTRYAPGADCASTLECLAGLGAQFSRDGNTVRIEGLGSRGFTRPGGALDCGNSGSTMRMLSGILAAQPFSTTLTGDASLCRRPMRRIVVPLERMGARVETTDSRPPLTVHGGPLRGIEFSMDTPSAQVKSAVLLAGIHADGRTRVIEPAVTRDHTERALAAFGATVDIDGMTVSVQGGQTLTGGEFGIPGDVSSAVFWAVAAAGLTGSEIELRHVGLNPSRTAVLNVLRRAGADVEVRPEHVVAGEPMGTIVVRARARHQLTIEPSEVPGLIDELPALAALGTFGGGMTVTGAAELRAKESDRITALVSGLRALGAAADELPDGFTIRGDRPLAGGIADACDDHRLAMAFAIAALGARGPSSIAGSGAVAVSYPGFFDVLERVCVQ